MEDDLSPCPFCGGEADRFTIEESDEVVNIGGDVICCQACGASSHVEFGHKENLVSAWNRRSLPAPGWQPIETAPSLERVIVSGYAKPSGRVAGYWWYYEDHTDENGVPADHPDATLFVLLSDVVPPFPPQPEEQEW